MRRKSSAKSFAAKVAGIEFAEHLVAAMAKENMRLFLLGAKPGVAEKAGENLCKKYPGLVLAGTQDGYFTDPQDGGGCDQRLRRGGRRVCLPWRPQAGTVYGKLYG